MRMRCWQLDKGGFSHSHLVKEQKEELPKVNTALVIHSTCNKIRPLRTKKERGKCCLAKHMEINPHGFLGSKDTAISIGMFLLVETVGHWQFAISSSPCPSPWEKLVPLTHRTLPEEHVNVT